MKKDRSILIVEDDSASALFLKQTLEKRGYAVLEPVKSAEEAYEAVNKESPSLILMDITLPGEIDGIEASKRISEENGIPSIFISASTDDATITRAREAMPFGYIVKPYNQNMVFASIDMALYRIRAERRIKDIELRNRNILAAIPDIVFYITPDGSYASETDRASTRGFWNEKVAEKALPAIKKSIESDSSQSFEYALKKDGMVSYLEARFVSSGESRVLAILRDVTPQKKAALALKNYQRDLEVKVKERTKELSLTNESLQEEIGVRKQIEDNLRVFSQTVEHNPHVAIIVDKNARVEYVNQAFCRVSGRDKDELVGIIVTIPGNPIISEPEVWETILKKSKWRGEMYNLNARGELYYMMADVTTITDDSGAVVHYIISAEDITSTKREKMTLNQIRESLDKNKANQLDMEMDWKEWKEKMLERNISRTDKSLFKNINNSFTQGAGFGALISLLDIIFSTISPENGKYVVDGSLFDLIQTNVNIVKEAFKTFASIDWIIGNDFDLTKKKLVELYDDVKAIISKADSLCSINENRIIINDFNQAYKDISIEINREFFYRAIFEIMINALKFSKRRSYVAVFFNVVNRDLHISVINEPEKSDEGVLGIPAEYEKVVFEPFYRLTKIVFEKYNTLDFGLGLTLVEKIIGKHGGEVVARNIMDHSDAKREAQVKVNVTVSLPLAQR